MTSTHGYATRWPVGAERLGLLDHNALLTLDSFNTAKMMKEQGTTYSIIPGGCTSKLQPLDVLINKPFKQVRVLDKLYSQVGVSCSRSHSKDQDSFQAARIGRDNECLAED